MAQVAIDYSPRKRVGLWTRRYGKALRLQHHNCCLEFWEKLSVDLEGDFSEILLWLCMLHRAQYWLFCALHYLMTAQYSRKISALKAMAHVRALSVQIILNGSYQTHMKPSPTLGAQRLRFSSAQLCPGPSAPSWAMLEERQSPAQLHAPAWPWRPIIPIPTHGLTVSFGLGPASSLGTCSVITSPDCNTDRRANFWASSSDLPHHCDTDPACLLNLSTISRSSLLTLLGTVGQALAKNALKFPPWPWLNFPQGAEPWQIRSRGFAHCYMTICWHVSEVQFYIVYNSVS